MILAPGLAFGTGSHATTASCLEWLDAADLEGSRVLDYGCGSGILAIAAARLGAREVVAVDIDPQALAATRRNAELNGVGAQIRVSGHIAQPDPGFDAILANILADPLIALAEKFASLAKPGARLVLAGLLGHQTQSVAFAYKTCFDIAEPTVVRGWVRLVGRRRASPDD